jgi:hypothetical protein
VLNPLCTPCSPIIEFADDTTMVVLITDNDETAYREEVSDNNLSM